MSNDFPWKNGWQARISAGLDRLGIPSMLAYSRAREGATYNELAKELGPGLAPIQIMFALRDEVKNSADFQYFARSSLVRYMRKHLPQGWKPRGELDGQFHMALVSWDASLSKAYKREYKMEVDAVLARFKELKDVPDSWIPATSDDPTLNELFMGIEFRYPLSAEPAIETRG